MCIFVTDISDERPLQPVVFKVHAYEIASSMCLLQSIYVLYYAREYITEAQGER